MKKSLIILVTAICNIHCFAQLPSYLPTNGLVAWYPFNGNANDKSGNGNNGTVFGATLITDHRGNTSSAYNFDGTAYIKGSCSNFPTQDRTVSLWYKIDDWSNHNTLMGYGGGNCGTSFFAVLNPSGIQEFHTASHCNVNDIFTANGYSENSKWNNWIITSNGIKTTFYLNGTKIYDTSVIYYGTNVSGKDFALGSMSSYQGYAPYSDQNVSYLKGSLDDIAIYNRVLDSNEIQQLYCSCTLPSATIPNKSILEGNSGTKQMKFAVTLSAAYADTVTIKYKTKNNTAIAGSDYIAKQGTLIFNPGQTTKNIIVTINGDTQQEANEKFFVLLSQPQNTIIADDTAIGTIRNDDTVAFARAEIEQQYQVTAGQHLMSITPNPTKGKFIINLPEDTNNDAAGMIEIVNLQGQVIQKETIPIHSKIKAITLPSGIAVGMYLVHFKINNKMYETKLIYQP